MGGGGACVHRMLQLTARIFKAKPVLFTYFAYFYIFIVFLLTQAYIKDTLVRFPFGRVVKRFTKSRNNDDAA